MAASEDGAGSQPCESQNHDDPDGENSLENNFEASHCAEERIRVDRRKLEILLQAGLKEGQNNSEGGEEFFQKIQVASNTIISWPSRLKIGAKSKKDPHIKVTGLPADIKKAKQMILSVLDVKTSRVTLKMDVSFTDHSHVIGRGGNCIKRVMQETGCHIHFPDSNRTSSEKSNQVSIAGHPHGVEAARKQIRELLPIVLMFEVPQNCLAVPDSSSTAIQSIAQKYNVSITFKQRPRAYGFIGTVRGLHSDPVSVRDAVLTLLEHLTGTLPVTVPVTTQIEIDCKHHAFIIGRNGSNMKQIMQRTGASIQFPDQSGIQGKRSTVFITGPIESAITAKIQLMEFLPLVLMFDVKDDEDDLVSDTRLINKLIDELDVLINVKSKPRQGTKSVIVKGIEKNAHNIYLTRCTLVKEDLSMAPMMSLPLPAPPMKLVNPYFYSPRMGMPMPGNEFPTALLAPAMNGKLQIPYSVNTNNNEVVTSSPLSSPLQSNSTSPAMVAQNGPAPKLVVNPVVGNYNGSNSPKPPAPGDMQKRADIPISLTNDKLISSDLVRTMSVDSLFKQDERNNEGIKGSNSTGHLSRINGEAGSPAARNEALEKSGGPDKLLALRKQSNGPFSDSLSKRRFPSDTKEKMPMPVGSRFSPTGNQESSHSIALNGSWSRSRPAIEVLGGVRNAPFSGSDSLSPDPVLSDSQSELSMSGSLSQTSNLIERLPFRKKKYNIADYELKRQMASKAITNETDYEEVRMPTGTWSGFGFSKSMPESILKDLWLKTSKSQMSKYSLVDNFQHSPSQSLNSSASSNESNHSNASSSSSCSSYSGPENSSMRRTQNSGPPPGLEGKPGMENAALLLNNNIDFNYVLTNESSLGTLAAVTDLCDLFSRIGLGKYSEVFVDQEVDLNTFMTLTDQDLKDIGVSTFGARRRMILAIQDLKKIHSQRDLSSPSTVTKAPLPQPVGQRCIPLDLASSSLRW